MQISAIQLRESVGVSGILVFILVLAVSYLIFQTIYRIYFHPLSSYPGPKLAAATRLWYARQLVIGNLAYGIAQLHEEYGSVVRVAPDELSFISSKSWNDIYGFRTGKPEMSKDSVFYTNKNMPTSIVNASKERHGFLRRLMSRGFSEAALRDQEPTIRHYVDVLMLRLGEQSEAGKAVEMTSWYNFLTFDVIGDLAFGEPFGCLESSTYHPWVGMIFEVIQFVAFGQALAYYPRLQVFAEYFVPKSFKQKSASHNAMTKEKALRRKESNVDKNDLLSNLFNPKNGIPDVELFGNSGAVIAAGSETTATVLSGVTWHLLRNPDAMKKLTEEVRTRFNSVDEITFVTMAHLKYMLACLNEAMRLFSPSPVGHARIVPGDGDFIDGRWVPGGTQVSIFRYAANVNSVNFTQSRSFIPERWLSDERFKNDDLAVMLPFSYGPRNCLGKNLALVEMRLVLARLLWTFDLELCDGMEEWDKCKIYITADKNPLWVKMKPVVRG